RLCRAASAAARYLVHCTHTLQAQNLVAVSFAARGQENGVPGDLALDNQGLPAAWHGDLKVQLRFLQLVMIQTNDSRLVSPAFRILIDRITVLKQPQNNDA